MNNLPKSIINLLKSTNKIDNLDAELLLAHILARPREYIAAHPEKKIGIVKRLKFKYLACQKAKGIPLAYLTGHKEFFGLDFIVGKHTLIPRPETEILVEEVIKDLRSKKEDVRNNIMLIDVGTGTGCIPIAINKSKNQKIKKSIAIDISKKALRVAKKNAKKHNVKINFLHGNLLESLKHKNPDAWVGIPTESRCKIGTDRRDIKTLKHIIITANLPYLSEEQYKNEHSIQHEPKIALIAQENGLALYKKLLQQIKQLITRYSLLVTGYFEIDPSQSARISAFIKEILPSTKIEIIKDLAGLNRVVVIHAIDKPIK